MTAFELAVQTLGIKLKHIRPYTPRHNGKVERSHREDQKRFYSNRTFYSFEDFARRLAAWQPRSNHPDATPGLPLPSGAPRKSTLSNMFD